MSAVRLDRQSLFSESNAIGNELAKYEHLNGRLFSQTEASDTAYLHTDALGSPLARTTQSALVEDRSNYTPWGTVTQGDSGRFGFTGHQRDPSGLYYAQQRYYDPETGTFLTEDPWQGDHSIPLSLHRFLYGYANPTVYVDEDGRCPQPISEIQCHFLTADLLGVDPISDDGIAAIHQEWAQQGQAQIAALSIYASGAAFLGVRTAAMSFGAGVRAFSDDVAQFGWRYALGVRTTQTVVAAELTGEGLALATGAELPPHLTPIATTVKHGKRVVVEIHESMRSVSHADNVTSRPATILQSNYRQEQSVRNLKNTDQDGTTSAIAASGPLSDVDANAPHIAKGNRPPYAARSRARDIVLQSDRVFVRVHGEGNKARSWMMRPQEIEGLTAQQIKERFALPDLPMFVSDVHVPAGTRIRVGTVGEQPDWGSGGAIQYELLERLPANSFQNTRALQ